MSNLKKSVSIAIGATFAASLAASPVANADENPFGMQNLESGYMQVAEGKCGEGKCGAGMMKKVEDAEGKCGEGKAKKEGKCGESKGAVKTIEGKCGEGKASKEGKCGESKEEKEDKTKKMEGKCGEGKCGGKS